MIDRLWSRLRFARGRALAASLSLLLVLAALPAQESRPSRGDERTPPPPPKDWVAEGEVLLKNARQHTFEGEKSGEAYFSPDEKMISFQSVRGDCPHYQIYVKKLDGTGLWRVTPGKGLTTCSHWRPDGKRMIWASTHLDPETYGPPPPEKGPYAWARHPSFDIFESDPDGGNVKRLTSTPGYDAEGSYAADGKRIVFTSERDGDPDIYTMAADGTDVRRVTHSPGYDGGPFFSPDGRRICFRGFRNPKNPRLANLYVVDADGNNEKQLTFDAAVNWAPYWHQNGDVLVWSKGMGGGRNFELFLIRLSDNSMVRLTRSAAQDVLPVFSHDGTKLMWTSTRADGRSQLFLADFRLPTEEEWRAGTEEEKNRLAEAVAHSETRPAHPDSRPPPDVKRLFGDASRLADDAMQGRKPGTEGAANAADFIEATLKAARLEPAGENGTYRQSFEVLVGVDPGSSNELQIGSVLIKPPDLTPMAFTRAPGSIVDCVGPIVFRGYGVAAPGVHDDYEGLTDVKGKVVLLFLRGIPDGLPSDNPHADPQAFSGSYAKAKAAKDKGAAGVVFVADSRQRLPSGAESLRPEGPNVDVGIPVARVSREALAKALAQVGSSLEALEAPPKRGPNPGFDLGVTASLMSSINVFRGSTDNVLAMVRGREKPDEVVILCAHYDHLGFGGPNSLAQGSAEIHNGADDNASGTAGILEIARRLAAAPPKRSVLIAAWTGEEDGLLGSAHWADQPTVNLERSVVGVVNLDMIGRLGEDGLALDGVASAAEFPDLVKQANASLGLKIGMTAGAMSGRSDHATFLHRGIPALHLFTGAHADYHRPSDDADKLNQEGMVRVAALAENLVRALADRDGRLAYVKPKAAEQTTPRGNGAWLGTIPSYGSDSGGVKLAGVSAGSPAEAAGLQAKDVLVKLNGAPIDNIYDFTNALGACRPGQEIEVVVKRGDETVTKQIKLGRR